MPVVRKTPIIFIILICFHFVMAGDYSTNNFAWQTGEELIYKVKWSFLTIGQLNLKVLGSDSLNNKLVYHCRIQLDSNPSLPFINIHDIFDSYIDANEFYSHIFIAYERKKDYLLYTRYNFDYESNKVAIIIEKRYSDRTEAILDSSVVIPEKVYDSLSLLYFARAMAQQDSLMEIPVFAYNKFEKTEINFSGEKKEIEINNKDIKCFYLEGQLKFVGVAGVKEDFRGWFSQDHQSVPLKAYMKAFIGSVKIELEQWSNWDSGQILSNSNKIK